MNRPEFLYTITVKETRQKYRENIKDLDMIFELALSGVLEVSKEIAGESVINRMMAELVIQQEYIREREKANWGWDRGDMDFSKQKSCILNCNETA